MYINSCRLTTAQKCANVYAALTFDDCEKAVSAAKFDREVVPGVVDFTEASLHDALCEITGRDSCGEWFDLRDNRLFPVLLNGIVESVINGYISTWEQYYQACKDAITMLRK